MPSTPQQQPVQQVIINAAPSNGMGTAGFVWSLIGLFTCGFLSPLGFIFSLIGIFRTPRGLAIAGLMLSGFGTAVLAFWGFTFAMTIMGIGAGTAAVDEAIRESVWEEKQQQQEPKNIPADKKKPPRETTPEECRKIIAATADLKRRIDQMKAEGWYLSRSPEAGRKWGEFLRPFLSDSNLLHSKIAVVEPLETRLYLVSPLGAVDNMFFSLGAGKLDMFASDEKRYKQYLREWDQHAEKHFKTADLNPGPLPEKKAETQPSIPPAPKQPDPQLTYHKWTSAGGGFTIEAALIDLDGNTVRLKKKTDGKIIEVQLDKMSAADRAYVKIMTTFE